LSSLPLTGIRILDFTWVVAGPVATRILADHGAEVIKLERKPGPPGDRQRGLQGDLHRNKLSIAVNMANPRGIEIAQRLAAKSDLVIDNFSARVMRGWGMDYASLSRVKPDIICVSMSGFGHVGPRASYVSYGPTLQALGGFTQMMADERGEPAGYGYSYADMAGGYTGALAALIALWHRRQTGRGQFIDLSQFEALVSLIGPVLLDTSVNGQTPSPTGYMIQEMASAPHGVYKCRPVGNDDDRWVAISIRTQPEWERFVEVIGSPAWAQNPEFRTLFMRMRKREQLDAHVESWTNTQDAEHVMELLQSVGVAAGVVSNGLDICARDPQLRARNFWGTVTLPDGARTHVTGVPIRMSATPGSVRTPSPLIGSSNGYVLGELLGYSETERDQLIIGGAVWA
jgi:crotonobetainyl-CoA:carnitine CoA-transferase CaiB-like acyl-CoA transferase